jgi:5-methylcytosine-specific restriction endonuclease McrA
VSRHWRYREEKLLPMILRRDGYACQIGGPGCTGTATEVDHIHPKNWGGRATPDNLRAACRHCNRAKGSKAAFFSAGTDRRAPWPWEATG